jgi:hypothetical protein
VIVVPPNSVVDLPIPSGASEQALMDHILKSERVRSGVDVIVLLQAYAWVAKISDVELRPAIKFIMTVATGATGQVLGQGELSSTDGLG